MDNIELKNQCIEKWKRDYALDVRLEIVKNEFEEWILQIPTDKRELTETLLSNLDYFPQSFVVLLMKELHQKLIEQCNPSIDDTIFTYIPSKGGQINSSIDYLLQYALVNSISKHVCIQDIDTLKKEQWEYIHNIVFIDDFSGSGKTFSNAIEKKKEMLSNKTIYFIVLGIMRGAIEHIEQYATKNDLSIKILFNTVYEKAFSQNLFVDNDRASRDLLTMSERFDIPIDEVFGFMHTEAIVAFYNNTPNNTLGVFRYGTRCYKSLFPRNNDPRPTWKNMKREKRKRKTQNYNKKVNKRNRYE